MLHDLVKKEFIRLRVRAKDWKEAIALSMQPLLEAGCVMQSYVEACISNVEKYGPYIVITKHVALVHAEREKGCLQDAVGIVSLETPVNFGNKDNDPVKYVFCLSARGNDSHLETLAELSGLLQDTRFFELLDHAEDGQEILDYVNGLPKPDENEL